MGRTKKEKKEMKTKTEKLIIKVSIIIGVILIFGSIYGIIDEFYGAKAFCKERDMEYSFSFSNSHTCNNISIYRYTDSWDFERNLTNLSELLLNYPD